MSLSVQQQQLVEQRIANEAKSPVLAYILWFFVGAFGAHRFYLGKIGTGAAMLVLFWLGVFTSVLAIGFVFLAIYGVWWLIDAFLIPGMIEADRNTKRALISAEVAAANPTEAS